MLDDFLIRAGLAALGTSLAASLLGCFVLWRRMAYFGDATAHAAILGVALSLGFSMSIFVGVTLVALLMGLALFMLELQGREVNSSLGVLAHTGLAAGLVAISVIPGMRVDLDAYLFGDVLTVGRVDLAVIWGGAVLVAIILVWRWQALLTSTLSRDLATAAGLNPNREQLILTLLLALVVAVAIKVVGALLITALLIIPAAAARGLARTPEAMAMVSVGIGGVAALAGLQIAIWADTPVGPTIVCTAAGMFAVSTLAGRVSG